MGQSIDVVIKPNAPAGAEIRGVDLCTLSDDGLAEVEGVLNDRGMANRWTFYIDKNGKIARVDQQVNTENHGKDIAAALKEISTK